MATRYWSNVQSAPMPRNAVCQVCRWVSTKPGSTILPVASTISASAASRAAATAAMRPSSMSTSPYGRSPTAGSMLTTMPPRKRVLIGRASRSAGELTSQL
ncbi:MAG TPA: hypothetical protein VGL93_33950 [Streptosporangiaceae bacterium]|jgi:hypothetical protein